MILLFLAAILSMLAPMPAHGQQMADPEFHPSVAEPAFTSRHPRILFDEAHHNFHTLDGRYQAFGDLVRADGFTTTPNREPFSAGSLAGADILVIANAMGDDPATGTDSTVAAPAFTPEEIEVVHAWVNAGGALLLIADHAPFGAAAAKLGARFGVAMSQGYTVDSLQAAGSGSATIIQFTLEAGTLGRHPIMDGRDEKERIHKVVAFTGQSLLGSEGSTPLLLLSDQAFDIPRPPAQFREDQEALTKAAIPARGRSMAVAMHLGKGRVVIQGEAAMLSAQIVELPGQEPYRFGMNQPGLDNQQFALNEMRWLAGWPGRAR